MKFFCQLYMPADRKMIPLAMLKCREPLKHIWNEQDRKRVMFFA